jgi:hypothetical protein
LFIRKPIRSNTTLNVARSRKRIKDDLDCYYYHS